VTLASYGGRLFAYAGASNWNSLPPYLRDSSLSLSSFKTTSKPFSSLSTRLAHAARLGSFTEKTRYINLLLLLVGVSFGVRRMNKCRKVKLYRSNDHKLVISKARNTNSGLFDGI